jgi:hypothetical protein
VTDNDAALRRALRRNYVDQRDHVAVLQCLWHLSVKVSEQYGAYLQHTRSRCDKDGSLKCVAKSRRDGKRDFAFVDDAEMTMRGLQRMYEDLERLRDGATSESIQQRNASAGSLERSQLVAAINRVVSKRYAEKHGTDAKPKAPSGKKASTAKARTASEAAADEETLKYDENGVVDEARELKKVLDVDNSGSLLPLLYNVLHSPTIPMYEANLVALKYAAIFSGMGRWMYDYLLAPDGYLASPHDVVFCYTNVWFDSDHTNNSSEQLHNVFANGGVQKARVRLANVTELVTKLVEYSTQRLADNLAKLLGACDSSPALRLYRVLCATGGGRKEVQSCRHDGRCQSLWRHESR